MNKSKLSYFDPMWILTEDNGTITPKDKVFDSEELPMVLEDFFQHNSVFLGMRGQKCHSDSYGTIVSRVKLEIKEKNKTDRLSGTYWSVIG